MVTEEPPIGPCLRVVDEGQEQICNNPGFKEILVRNRFGLFAVAICLDCAKLHDEFYRRIRNNRVTRRVAQPLTRENSCHQLSP